MIIRALVPSVLSLAVLMGASQDKPKSIKEAMAATHKGMPRSRRPTQVSAAKNTIAPCAKLNTPEAL